MSARRRRLLARPSGAGPKRGYAGAGLKRGYTGAGQVFTANMTGNVVLLGFGIAGSHGLPVLAPVCSLFAFVFGSVASGGPSAQN